jgi:hypothetical protein
VAAKFRGNVGDLVSAELVEDVVRMVEWPADGPSTGHTVARLARVVLETL